MKTSSWIACAIVLTSAPERAEACGGFFCGQAPVLQVSEQIVFAVDEEKTVAYVQLRYEGSDPNFAWVIPVPEAPEVEVGVGQAMFDALEMQTRPTFVLPQLNAGVPTAVSAESGASCAGDSASRERGPAIDARLVPAPEVDVLKSARVGPYEYVTLDAENAFDLNTWLTINGYRVAPGSDEIVEAYLAEGMKLLALKLAPEETATSVEPIKLTFEETRGCTIPIRLTAIASRPGLDIVVWVFGAARAVPANYAAIELDHSRLRSPSDYLPLLTRALDDAGGQAFVTEYAQSSAQLSTFGDATLAALIEKNAYVTRLRTQLDPEEMTVDPVFDTKPGGQDVSNQINLAGSMSLGAGSLLAILAVVLLFFTGCGTSSPPVVTDLALSAKRVRAGEEVLARFVVEDADGDLDQAEIHVALRSGELELKTVLGASGVAEGQTRAPLIAAITPNDQVPAAMYELELVVADNDGNTSAPVSTGLLCTKE